MKFYSSLSLSLFFRQKDQGEDEPDISLSTTSYGTHPAIKAEEIGCLRQILSSNISTRDFVLTSRLNQHAISQLILLRINYSFLSNSS